MLTYADLYAAYAPAHEARPPGTGASTPWTREELVAILHAYVAQNARYPPYEDLHPDCGLPPRSVIRRVCGSVQAWYALVPCPAPVRQCLKCGRHQERWICLRCRAKASMQQGTAVGADGSWMNGVALTEETGSVDADVLEFIGPAPVRPRRRYHE